MLHLEHGAESWALRKADQKYLESFEMWCWERMDKISWIDHVTNEVVSHRVKEERNIPHTIKIRKANWIGHILRRNRLLKHVIQGKLEGRIEGKKDEEEDVSSYWITLRKREGRGN
jgi:uncharacterized protein YnzC (UPF0291/DUF896 family)